MLKLCQISLLGDVDTGVSPLSARLASFVEPLTHAPSTAMTLEQAAMPRPFLPIYQDLLALQSASSRASHDRIFAAVIIAPLAMTYAVDYRRLFWLDHAQSLRGIDVALSALFFESQAGLEAYTAPNESDPAVLGGMAAALSNGRLARGSALRDIAVHHLTAAWADGRALALESTFSKTDAALRDDLGL